MSSNCIKEMPEEDRPRERLARLGAKSLSDAELLAIFIRTGTKGRNALEIARELLLLHGDWNGLSRCSKLEIQKSAKGIGDAKACELAAIFEIANRLSRGTLTRKRIKTPEEIYEIVGSELQMLRQEVVRVLLLNTKFELLAIEEVSSGSVNETVAHPREIFRPALVHSAFAIAVVHNHPSGDPTPSEADRILTRRLVQSAGILTIRLLDHVIVGSPAPNRKAFFSFREAGEI